MDHAHASGSDNDISSNATMVPQTPGLDATSTRLDSVERRAMEAYRPPSMPPASKVLEYVYNPNDGSVLLDHRGQPVTVDKLLATKPLRADLSTRPGPGNKKLTYISGDGVTRTLNDIFGFDGWNLDISKVQREECLKDEKTGKYTVVYTAMARLTHRASGSYREDCGSGDSTDRCFATAVSHALKASVTDAMKRAARHFGEKLGNSLYQGTFNINKAPVSLKDALDKFDIERANSKFGFHPMTGTKPDSVASENVANHPTATAQPISVSNQGIQGPPTKNRILPPIHQNQAANKPTLLKPQVTMPPGADSTSLSSVSTNSSGVESHQPKSASLQVLPGTGNREASEMNPVSNSPAIGPISTPAQCAREPPPTPIDSLRKSALFGYSNMRGVEQVVKARSNTLPFASAEASPVGERPQSAHGRDSRPVLSDSRRLSVGDGLPIIPMPIVTPATGSRPNPSYKRMAPDSACPNDSARPKKAAVNPYSMSNGETGNRR